MTFNLQDRGEFDYRKTAKKKNRQGSTSSGPEKEKENATDDEDQLIKRAASKDSVASEFSDKAFHIQNTASTVPLVKVLLPDMSSAVIAARTVLMFAADHQEFHPSSLGFVESGTRWSADLQMQVFAYPMRSIAHRPSFHRAVVGYLHL